MQIGLKLASPSVDWPAVEALWRRAGEHEVIDSVWTNDHLEVGGGRTWEGWTLLAALAHHVPDKTVGHLVLANPFRHPVVLAKAAVNMDHLTGGRFVLGLGVGSWPPEFEAFGIPLLPVRERLSQLEAALQLLGCLFGRGSKLPSEADKGRRGPLTFQAGGYGLRDAWLDPAPRSAGGPRIWLGTQGEIVGLRLVAQYADGWNFSGEGGTAAFVAKRSALARHCERVGRDFGSVTVSCQIAVGEDMSSTLTDAAAYVDAGVDHVILFIDPKTGVTGLDRAIAEVAVPLREKAG